MQVLIIEDSPAISQIISKTMESYGYITHILTSNDHLKSSISNISFDLMILSTNLTKGKSIETCKHVRDKYPTRFIIGINNKGSWRDRLEILNNGADDCLTFPFPTQELLARIQALLRRPRVPAQTDITFGKIKIKPFEKKVKYKNRKLDLSKKEYHVLEYLVRNTGRTISRAELMDHVWDYKKISSSNTVDVHIQKIRKKIAHVSYKNKRFENLPELTEIKTVHGIGYKLENIA